VRSATASQRATQADDAPTMQPRLRARRRRHTLAQTAPSARPAEAATLKGRPRRTGYPARTGARGPLVSTLAAWGRHGAQPDRPPPRSEKARQSRLSGFPTHRRTCPPSHRAAPPAAACGAGALASVRRTARRAARATRRRSPARLSSRRCTYLAARGLGAHRAVRWHCAIPAHNSRMHAPRCVGRGRVFARALACART
jgi:hypothetical protein